MHRVAVKLPTTLAKWLVRDDATLVTVDGRVVPLSRRVRERAGGLPAGLVVVAGGPEDLAVDVLAVLSAGGAAFVVPTGSDARAVALEVGARGLLLNGADFEALPGRRELPEGAALVLQTSGSSGVPRRVVLTAEGIAANVQAILGYLPVRGRIGIELPLHYSYALVGQLFTALAAGAEPVLLHSSFVAARVETARQLGVTGLSSVGSALEGWCAVLEDLPAEQRPALQFVASAGGPLSAALAQRLRRVFPEALLFNQYGQTEASPRVTALSSDDPRFFEGAVGFSLEGISVALQAGELVVHSPSVMWGYLDAPEATARKLDGGLRTGDQARIDDDGCVWIEGRSDDLVNLGGERLSLVQLQHEVEAALGLGFGLAVHEEVLVAVVEAETVDVRGWKRACRGLPASHRPGRWCAVAALPRLSTGKLDRQALQALIRVEPS